MIANLFRKKKTLGESGILNGLTDWHCHILPGVDDGFKTIEESLEALRIYESNGVRQVWLTPHIMEDYPLNPEKLGMVFDCMKKAWHGNVEISLAAEHMLDSMFVVRLDEGSVLPLGNEKRHLLIETSYFAAPANFREIIDAIMAKGMYPVLAHPERYSYMDKGDYEDLKERGVMFQVNIPSITGAYGDNARIKAEWLLENDFIDICGSDMHAWTKMLGALTSRVKNKNALSRLLDIAPTPIL